MEFTAINSPNGDLKHLKSIQESPLSVDDSPEDKESTTAESSGDIDYASIKQHVDMSVAANEARMKYNSSSSIYSKHTIITVPKEEVAYCIASIIHSQVFETENACFKAFQEDFSAGLAFEANLFRGIHMWISIFDNRTELPPHQGGMGRPVDEELRKELENDPELLNLVSRGLCPTVDTICRFIVHLCNSFHLTSDEIMVAFIYLNRLLSPENPAEPSVVLGNKNWRLLWACCVLLSHKMWNETTSYKTNNFAALLGVDENLLKTAELRVLTKLNYNLLVKQSVFAKNYFCLRDLSASACQGQGAPNMLHWSDLPLTASATLQHRLGNKEVKFQRKEEGKVTKDDAMHTEKARFVLS